MHFCEPGCPGCLAHGGRPRVGVQVLGRCGLSLEALAQEGHNPNSPLAAWKEAQLHDLVAHFVAARFPMLLALNKAGDTPARLLAPAPSVLQPCRPPAGSLPSIPGQPSPPFATSTQQRSSGLVAPLPRLTVPCSRIRPPKPPRSDITLIAIPPPCPPAGGRAGRAAGGGGGAPGAAP